MNRILVIAAGLALLPATTRAADPVKRPNILLIYADDQSYKTVGCYPGAWPWVRTPNIDALAAAGVRFRGAYLGAWCMPSRASLLTGHQPHGIQSMRSEGTYPGSTYDPKQCPFWPAVFRANGYHTAQIGKWHTGTDAGFGRDWDYQVVWNRPRHPENAGAYYEWEIVAVNGREEWADGYPADNYTRWAVGYVRGANRDKDKPWFLWLCYGSIHGPSKPAARHKGRYKDAAVPEPADLLGPWPGKPDYLKDTLAWRRDKDGTVRAGSNGEKVGDEAGGKGTVFADWVRQVNECVPAVDEGVGELVKALKETGQLDNTLVVYTADQGFAMGEHGMRMKIAPYEASYRSPLVVVRPGVVAAGKVCPQVATAPDLVATFFAHAGVKPPAGLHGRDLTPLLTDPAADWPHPCLYEHTGDHYGDDVAAVLRADPAKAIYQKVPWYTAVVQGGWKYVRYLRPGVPEELYDLATDPDEMKNLAADPAHAARLARLRAALAAELQRTAAPAALIPPEPPQPLPKQTHTFKTVGGLAIQADVYRADDATVRPVVVWIHGGALISGNRKAVPQNLLDLCRAEGYALVSLDYRLAPEVKLPEIIADLADAFRWLRGDGAKLCRLDPHRIVVTGGSAGGYLTLMAGTVVRPRPKGLVAYWGYGDVDGDWYTKPSEFYRKTVPLIDRAEAFKGVGGKSITGSENGVDLKARGRFYLYLRQNGLWTKEVTGFDPVKDRAKLDPYCPVRNVSPEYPPTLLVHGTEDTDVPYQLSADMAKELARHKVPHELVTVPGAGHGLSGGDRKLAADAHAKALAFIRARLKAGD